MKFSEWAKLQEAGGATDASGQNSAVVPSSISKTVDYRGGRVRNYRDFQPVEPTGSPSGTKHSDPKLEEARVQLGKLAEQAHAILTYVKGSDHWKRFPQFQRPFLDKMTKAIDGMTESQAILSADSSQGHEGRGIG